MPASDHGTAVEAGLWSFVVAGLIIGLGILVRGPQEAIQNPAADPVSFATLVTSASFLVWMIATVLSVPLRMFGFLALFALLRRGPHRRLSLVALAVALTAMALFAHVIGVSHFVWPDVGARYLAGQEGVLELAGFGDYAMSVFGVTLLLGLLALILYGVAMWRDASIPRGATALFVLQIVPLNLGGVLGHVVESAGGFMLALSAVWIIVSIRRQS